MIQTMYANNYINKCQPKTFLLQSFLYGHFDFKWRRTVVKKKILSLDLMSIWSSFNIYRMAVGRFLCRIEYDHLF